MATTPARMAQPAPVYEDEPEPPVVKMTHPAPFYDGEPERPVVKTEVPGPVSKKEIKALHEVFDTRALTLLTDYSKCSGNYIADRDGNMLLDV